MFGLLCMALMAGALVSPSLTPSQAQQPAPGAPATSPTASPTTGGAPGPAASAFGTQGQQSGLNIVVLDPAHGGTDPGARGTGGIRERQIARDVRVQLRRTLELQGFR